LKEQKTIYYYPYLQVTRVSPDAKPERKALEE